MTSRWSTLWLVATLALFCASAAAQAPAAPRSTAKASTKAANKKATAAVKPAAAAPVKRGYDHRLEEIRARGEIVVGVSRFAPWALNDPKVGWIGFEIDVARQLAADLGVTLKIVEIPFPRLLEAVRNGDVDVAPGISIAPRRALLIAFSRPYGESKLALVVRKQDVARTNWNAPEVKIGLRAGSISEIAAAENYPLATIAPFEGDAAMFAALDAGSVDGVLAFTPQPQIRMAIKPDTVAIAAGGESLGSTVDGFAVRQGEPSLVNFLDAWIAYWKADGWLESSRQHWFGSVDWVTRLSPN